MSTKMSSRSRSRGTQTAAWPELMGLLAGLPPSKQDELLDFARFLHQQATSKTAQSDARVELRDLPAESLIGLTAIVHLGGDAVRDTEALYDGF